MANVTPKAILYKGQIVRFSNKELQLITMKAATSGITPYKAAREVAAGQVMAAKPTQTKPTQTKPARPNTARPNTALLSIYHAYVGNIYDSHTSEDAFDALVEDNKALANAETCKATLEAFLADPSPINYNAMNGAILLYQAYEH